MSLVQRQSRESLQRILRRSAGCAALAFLALPSRASAQRWQPGVRAVGDLETGFAVSRPGGTDYIFDGAAGGGLALRTILGDRAELQIRATFAVHGIVAAAFSRGAAVNPGDWYRSSAVSIRVESVVRWRPGPMFFLGGGPELRTNVLAGRVARSWNGGTDDVIDASNGVRGVFEIGFVTPRGGHFEFARRGAGGMNVHRGSVLPAFEFGVAMGWFWPR